MVREVVVVSPPGYLFFQLERCSQFFSRLKAEDVQLGRQIFVEGM